MKLSSSRPDGTNPRRSFIKKTGALLGGSVLISSLPAAAKGYFLSPGTLKIALIGCGDRGTGAAVNALRTKGAVELVAMADVFRDKIDESLSLLNKVEDIKGKINVPEANRFTGFDAYEKAMRLADIVLLVAPPAFRPLHFEAAIKAGKHVFMEKPLASDAPGIRQVLETGKLASTKNLKVVVGLQNRYDPAFIEMVDKMKQGVIGTITAATDYYMIGPLKQVKRTAGQSEMEYQLRNWRYFNWLWAGSPAGLQIHNTDVVNWFKGSYPVRAQAIGGKAMQGQPDMGDIFDNFAIEYEYEDGFKLNSYIRHLPGTYTKGGAYFQGSNGTASIHSGIRDASGERIWRRQSGSTENAYQIEHDKLFEAIRNNTPLNDTEWGAMSTMTTLLGRMAAHSGKLVEWKDAIQSELTLLPKRFGWDAEAPVLPDKNGLYPFAIPGSSPVL
ncbi:Gfo/Idh/MocA family oxidoreductase [Flavihumibacter sp. CACIAM 22H1]|uniref:Gfo/Idh/MocA family protein n=1 Tax=Flavihumibacter sp. CACIAM 22H1 TaxID=1812911 RepID=UPI000AFCF1F3|nr:Gfo/Idh/MocA family oxidoreductase [Flavihumibacter sp. CACIAM 22H1]